MNNNNFKIECLVKALNGLLFLPELNCDDPEKELTDAVKYAEEILEGLGYKYTIEGYVKK